MATPLGRTPADASRRRSSRRPVLAGRVVLALAGVIGVLFSTVPAQAAPVTSAEAAELVAARGHELEVITEQFNEAREVLIAQQGAAQAAAAQLEQATAALAAAQQSVRGIARSAWTGEGLGSFQALMTSDSADDFVDRMSTLQLVAGHQSGILEAAAGANVAAAQAQATAQDAAAQAQASYDSVAAQQADLQKQVDEYQAMYDQLSAEEQRAAGDASHGDRASRSTDREPAAGGPVVASSDAAQIIVDTALAQRGKPYVWAAAGPGSFDCSGLTAYAFRAAGIGLPHSSRLQAQMGQGVSRSELQPGDLVAFYSPVSHIGIYIGNGQMVHAPTSGDVVKVSSIDTMGSITAMRRLVA
ncbi:C40 family peptidase [Blastococcus sp. CT_GayMR16]|uniref:C40 family peptidase n=1 Tax=Blastococcus sp. CT_GayMR16 TaxID=2559607 RepID=UPI001072FE7F|nr:C40 family peptidase [Blastococcus sp. CT_GayMR16]TFV86611.1 NlpC/P60 family protein [Blastococcus sp. CT_GayMR16]